MAEVDPTEAVIVKFIRAWLEWARVRIQGPMQKDLDSTIDIILPAITKTIGRVGHIDVNAAETITAMLATSVMSEAGEKEILEAVDKTVNILGGTKTGAKQELMHPEHYQSIATWEDCDRVGEGEVDPKLLSMATRLRKCGCNKLTEPSFAAATPVTLHNLSLIHI